MLPPLNALRTFEVAARHLSLTRAARELNVTQGAVSKQIAHLEDVLGVPVFERHHRRLTLTPAGQQLAEHLTPMFRGLAAACERIRAADPSRLAIQLTPTIAIRWFFPRLPQIQSRLPDIRLEVTTRWFEAEKALPDELVPYDVVIFCAPRHHRLPACFLRDEIMRPVASPALLARWGGDVRAALAHAPLLHLEASQQDWSRWFTQTGYHREGPVAPELRFDSLDMALTAALQGHGIVLMDMPFVINEVSSGALRCLTPQTPFDSGWAYFVHLPRDDRQEQARPLLDWLKSETERDAHRVHDWLGTLE